MPSAIAPNNSEPVNASKSLPASAMPLISPSALLQAHLTQNPPIRPSGRSPTQPHPIDLNVGSLTHCNGSSVVRIGNTTIVCGIRGEILPVSEIPSYTPELQNNKSKYSNGSGTQYSHNAPSIQSPAALYNLLVPNLDLSTGCSPLHAPNTPPSSQAQSLTQRIYTLLHITNLIPSSTLEISYTPPSSSDSTTTSPDDPSYIPQTTTLKAYWTLYIDMVCLSYGGESSVFDASWFAMLAALHNTILPHAWWDADEQRILCDADVSKAKKLHVGKSLPVPLGFGVFEFEKIGGVGGGGDGIGNGNGNGETKESMLLVDIDAFEEESCFERGCVVVAAAAAGVNEAQDAEGEESADDKMEEDVDVQTRKKQIVRIEKSGGSIIDIASIKEVIGLAEKRWDDWKSILDRALVGV